MADSQGRSIDLMTVGEPLRGLVAMGETLDRATTFRFTMVGAESNVAVAVARLGHRSAIVANVGDDGSGGFVMRELRAEGVDVTAVAVRPRSATGLLLRNSSMRGAISVEYRRTGSAGAQVSPEQVQSAWQRGRPRLVHLSGITPMLSEVAAGAAESLIDLARKDQVPVSFDINLRQRLAPLERWQSMVRDLAPRADIVFGNDEELALLGDPDRATADLVAAGAVVVRKHPDLSVTHESDGGRITVPALTASLVDPVGAGDALVGGFLSGLLLDLPAVECLKRGVGCAAFAVEHWSDSGSLPDGPALADRLADDQRDQVRR